MIFRQFIRSRFTKVLIPLSIVAQLVACGGGGGSPAVTSSSPVVTSTPVAPASPVAPTPVAPTPEAPTPVTPTPVSTGSATLNWTAPAARSDGSPLSLADIQGYRVYYGTSAGNYPNTIDIADGTAVQVTLNNLPVGKYYVVMTTYDVAGRESVFSPEVTKTI